MVRVSAEWANRASSSASIARPRVAFRSYSSSPIACRRCATVGSRRGKATVSGKLRAMVAMRPVDAITPVPTLVVRHDVDVDRHDGLTNAGLDEGEDRSH